MDVDDDQLFKNGVAFDELEGASSAAGDESIARARQVDDALVASLDLRKAARSLAVPTDDAKVRIKLRALGLPHTLFGERRPDRRERLREALVQEKQRRKETGEESEPESVKSEESEDSEVSSMQERCFKLTLTDSSSSLYSARGRILHTRFRCSAARSTRHCAHLTPCGQAAPTASASRSHGLPRQHRSAAQATLRAAPKNDQLGLADWRCQTHQRSQVRARHTGARQAGKDGRWKITSCR